MAKQRKYTEALEREAVRMMRNRGDRTVTQVADDLGVNANQLQRGAGKTAQEAAAKRNDKGEALEECRGAHRKADHMYSDCVKRVDKSGDAGWSSAPHVC